MEVERGKKNDDMRTEEIKTGKAENMSSIAGKNGDGFGCKTVGTGENVM